MAAERIRTLETIEQRLLWLSTLIIHHANNVRPNPPRPDRRASFRASVVSIMTALYFHFLKRGPRRH